MQGPGFDGSIHAYTHTHKTVPGKEYRVWVTHSVMEAVEAQMTVSGLHREVSHHHGMSLKFSWRRNDELAWGAHLGGSAGLANAHSGCR